MKKMMYLLLPALLLGSCRKQEEENSPLPLQHLPPASSQLELSDEPQPMVLGPALQNPYTVSNMQQALATLGAAGALACGAGSFQVRCTHYYIKFKPQTDADFEKLLDDTNLVLYDYPLDREIVENGVYYRESGLAENVPQPQYTCVKAGYTLPAVNYETLAELYIPEEDPLLLYEDNSSLDTCIDQLVEESLRRTGNLDSFNVVETDTNAPASLFSRRDKWNPWGFIRYYDNTVNKHKGLEGAKVRSRRWFTTHEALTDMNGYFHINEKYRRDVNYCIKWERGEYDIRSGEIGQAYFNGPKQTGPWVLNIASGASRFYAHIHMAAHDYYYRNNLIGVSAPPRNSFWRPRLKIAAKYGSNVDHEGATIPQLRLFGIAAIIRIYNPERVSDEIYGTTIHELAHYAHWGLDNNSYNNGSNKLAESWSRVMQWTFANRRYIKLYGKQNWQHWKGWQNLHIGDWAWVSHMHNGYTPVFIDMLDSINQHTAPEYGNGSLLYVRDPIRGFIIQDIENALPGSLSLNDMKNKLNLLNKANPVEMDTLYTFYNNL